MTDQILKLHHGAASVPKLDESIAWYRNMLGFEVVQRVQIPGQSVEFAMMKRGDVHMELFEAQNSKPLDPSRREPNLDFRTQGNLHVAFAVPDVHALADELRAKGADIVWVRDFEWGSNAFVRDNAGNLIEFLEQKDLA